jgi:serine/threonine-protein kinase RsbW
MRRVLSSFLTALDLEESKRIEIVTAVGEALANTIEHAYDGRLAGNVEMLVRTENGRTLRVEILDHGTFLERAPRQGRGFGLKIMRAAVESMSIDKRSGTSIRMLFDVGDGCVC